MAFKGCPKVFSGATRDLIGFDDINEKHDIDVQLKRERLFRHIRRDYPKIVDTIGEQHYKVPALNK
jgi:hypothetical protein